MHLKDLNWCKLKFITDILFIYVFSILGFIRVSMGLRIWVSDHCSIGSITWEPSIEYLHILLNVNRKVANLRQSTKLRNLCCLSGFLWYRVATKKKYTAPSVPIAKAEVTSLRKVSGGHHYLINRYGLSVPLMTTNKFLSS